MKPELSPQKVAEWLLIGYIKHWTMSDVPAALGVVRTREEELLELSKACPFMPSSFWQYQRPVRAFVASEWPKLNKWLLDHESNPAKCLACVPEIMKLACSNTTKGGFLSDSDKEDGRVARVALRVTRAGNAARRAQRASNSRGAWNTCKA
jgi:hypothetical protein